MFSCYTVKITALSCLPCNKFVHVTLQLKFSLLTAFNKGCLGLPQFLSLLSTLFNAVFCSSVFIQNLLQVGEAFLFKGYTWAKLVMSCKHAIWHGIISVRSDPLSD